MFNFNIRELLVEDILNNPEEVGIVKEILEFDAQESESVNRDKMVITGFKEDIMQKKYIGSLLIKFKIIQF